MQNQNLKLGQSVHYAGHGVGTVVGIPSKSIAGSAIEFYEIKINGSDVTVLAPTSKVKAGLIPVRPIESLSVISVVRQLGQAKPLAEVSTWNARYRLYMELIQSGQFSEIIRVLADVLRMRSVKVLSFGERKIGDLAKGLIVAELAASLGCEIELAEAEFSEMIEKSKLFA